MQVTLTCLHLRCEEEGGCARKALRWVVMKKQGSKGSPNAHLLARPSRTSDTFTRSHLFHSTVITSLLDTP